MIKNQIRKSLSREVVKAPAKNFTRFEIWGQDGGPGGVNGTEALERLNTSKVGVVSSRVPS
jgi:hypothetical protein